jgi:GNAT superfamily N-acetyltransferase
MLDEASYIIISPGFKEPLFNHATILTEGPGAEIAIGEAIRRFKGSSVPPSFFIVDEPRYSRTRSLLESAGFGVVETMEVMVALPFRLGERETVDLLEVRTDLRGWVEAYVRSFYGDGAPTAEVEAAAENAAKDRDVSLVLAMRGEDTVGEMALFRRGGLLGAYCVGTVPGQRRSGVAREMLAYARKMAIKQGLNLVLQTFAGDSLVGFYGRQGFGTVYRKLILSATSNSG